MSKVKKFSNVWDAIETTPQQAASLRARSELLMAVQSWGMETEQTQAAIAALLGISQPRMSDLMRGRLHLFSVETLMDMATTAGMEPNISIKRRKSRAGRQAGSLVAAL